MDTTGDEKATLFLHKNHWLFPSVSSTAEEHAKRLNDSPLKLVACLHTLPDRSFTY